jgi:amidase/aspartyl-tRNA(Asn)/glutamyl-tRNA(Gln) amidotransferase subunit A
LSAYRLGVPTALMLDELDPTVSRAWQRTLSALRQGGARLEEIALPELHELQPMQAHGSFSAAESYAWHHALITSQADRYDPRVASRIERGAQMTARDYLELHRARQNWIHRMEVAARGFDAFLSPTVPVVASPIAQVAPGTERDAAFFRLNALLLRNTSVVNMLDGCAVSIPCHAPDELPVGLMVWAGALRDDSVLNIARQIELLLYK